MDTKYDVIIVGGGPAGLSAAVYCRRALLRTLVVEKDYMGLGMIAAADRVENYPGVPSVQGYDLAMAMHRQAETLGAEFLEAHVEEIEPAKTGFLLQCKQHAPLSARCVIYAAGASYRRLEVPGIEQMGVSYCATCDGAFYHGQEVAVIGGGDAAFDDALYLSGIASKVYPIHRSDAFRANAAAQQRLAGRSNIECIRNAVVTRILGDARAEGLTYEQDGAEHRLMVKGIFSAIGRVPDTGIIRHREILDKDGYIRAGEDCITAIPGFCAAGDVRTKRLRQAITAAADGANAAASAELFLRG
ncbi:MAG: FAD-dependent oxidoreductase [Oscillospiraceae bacterium]|nr:FAD-dependent oxidoreductase [Oscillospiraceae bacterium]